MPRNRHDAVERGVRVVDEVAVAQHQHLLAGEVLEEVGELAAVHPQARGSARTAPSRRRCGAPRARRPRPRRRRARGRRPTGASSWSRAGPPGRAAPRRAAPAAGRRRSDGGRRGGRGRTACSPRASWSSPAFVEQVEVALPLPDPLPVAVRVARTPVRRRRRVPAEVVLRLLGGLRNSSGCCASAACRAVVPAFGAPTSRKSGSRPPREAPGRSRGACETMDRL